MEFQLDQYKDNLLCLYEGEMVKRNINVTKYLIYWYLKVQ